MLPKKNRNIYLLIVPVILFVFIGQMPDWVLMKDLEGNRYYMDRQGKIYTSDTPSEYHKVVTVKGIEYFVNKGISLWENNHRARGLSLLKSALALPVKNQKVYQMQKNASAFIDRMKRREGSRYNKIDRMSHILLYQGDNGRSHFVNEMTGYRLTFPGSVYLLKKNVRSDHNGYVYSGVRLGIVLKQDTTGKGDDPVVYDMLVGIESEIFPSKLRSSGAFEKHWKRIIGSDTFKRTALRRDNTFILYSFVDKKGEFAGMEGYRIKGNRGCFIRCILPESRFSENKDAISTIIESLSM